MNMDVKKDLEAHSVSTKNRSSLQSTTSTTQRAQEVSDGYGKKFRKEDGKRASSNMVFENNQQGFSLEFGKKPDAEQEVATQMPIEPFRYAGYLGCILASVTLSTAMLLVKLLPVENCISEKAKATFFRGLFMMIFCGTTIVYQGLSLKVPRGEYLVNLARAVLGGCNVLIAYISIQFITIGERSAVSYLNCLWTSLLGFIILREPLKPTLLVAIPVSFLGIILIAKPSLIVDPEEEIIELLPQAHEAMNTTDIMHLESADISEEYYFNHRWIGIVTSLVGSFTVSMSTIVLKFRKKTPIVTCSFYFGLAMALVSVGVQLVVGFAAMPTIWLEWFLHVCIGLISYIAQCVVQWSLQFVPAGTFSTIFSIGIVTSYFMGVVFLHELILWTSLVGSVLIVSVVILLIFNDRIVSCFR